MDNAESEKLLAKSQLKPEIQEILRDTFFALKIKTFSSVSGFITVAEKICELVPENPEKHGEDFKLQAVNALCGIITQNNIPPSRFSRKKICEDFLELITPEAENTPFTGHSISFECEPYAGREDIQSHEHELRIGPFRSYQNIWKKLSIAHEFTGLDKQAPYGTMHLNWGLSVDQRER